MHYNNDIKLTQVANQIATPKEVTGNVLPRKETYTLANVISLKFNPGTSFYGRNINLSEDGLEIHRIDLDLDYGTCAYIATPLRHVFEFELKVIGWDNSRESSLQIGISRCRKVPYEYLDIPRKIDRTHDDSCTWRGDMVYNGFSDSLRKTKYGIVDLHNIYRNDTIGMCLRADGDLFFFVNGFSQGRAASNVYTESFDVYPVVCIRGKCTAVRIIRAGLSYWLNYI